MHHLVSRVRKTDENREDLKFALIRSLSLKCLIVVSLTLSIKRYNRVWWPLSGKINCATCDKCWSASCITIIRTGESLGNDIREYFFNANFPSLLWDNRINEVRVWLKIKNFENGRTNTWDMKLWQMKIINFAKIVTLQNKSLIRSVTRTSSRTEEHRRPSFKRWNFDAWPILFAQYWQ